ncbi:type 1 glutamine amidotransferase domain-containing protein [Conexibacter sp. W3-3-2]|uniref:type 1 glutamine amidotransferase domain-containing protein n=1 Tax=Conexibacter sp. W3-3-2 TaxID=2675227 RepID=UPI00132C0447|nr:type 1 glutamine amidotransferase domain-containing protein [Conexibacter sp. W3-3-2]MTD44825.1 type 1 glutamine amidotransferase domain-containing protein [Conexibacter sp. W3-3-2]
MSASIDVLNPDRPKRVLLVASNPAVSPVTGWPVGFWWAELVHPWWAFTERGYEVTIASPDGGALTADSWSDPRDESGYSAHDLLSLGFISSPEHAALVQDTPALADVDLDAHDAIMLVGGQAPMVTFVDDERVHTALSAFHDSGRAAAAICHATCVLLKARSATGELLVAGRTWTGFANSEEDFADEYVGQRIQPFRIEDEGRALPGTNMIVASRFKSHAIRDGNLITGQQQYSGAAAAQLVIEALGV